MINTVNEKKFFKYKVKPIETKEEKTNDFNVTLGQTIKNIRKSIGMTQGDFANILGISSQQIHKYETGTDRISIEMLYKISNTIGCDIKLFLPKSETNNQIKPMYKVAEPTLKFNNKAKNKSYEAIELVKMFLSLPSEKRQAVINFVKKIQNKEK